MPYRLIDDDPDPASVRRLTFVPFLPDGRCMVLPGAGLPSGEVRPGEHPFAADGDHVYAWLDGDRYTGDRPHASVDAVIANVDDLAGRLDAAHAARWSWTACRSISPGEG